MKKRTKKIIVSVLAASTIMVFPSFSLANKITVNMPYSIYETIKSENISSGVVHENIKRFTSAGWWHINVLRINLKDEYTELKGLFNSNGIPNRDKVTTMVEKSNAIAAINGDYFEYNPLASSMGPLINNGELISSPIELSYAKPTFYLNQFNQASIDYLGRRMNAINSTTGVTAPINTVNKVTPDFDTLTLLNKHWGSKSIGNRFHKDLLEVIVQNNVVIDVRKGQEAVNIPENGYVLAVRGEREVVKSLSTFKVGDKIKLDIDTIPNVDSLKFAIGGGSIILKDGELSLTNIISKGNEPRTGIGINKDSTELILVTIDGRDDSFKGVSQEMFGAILKQLGAYNGINLDGGGSTAMAIKPKDENKATLVNKPSGDTERAVVNSVGVFSNSPLGELSYLKISTDDNRMFLNTTRKFTVKGYDSHHNPIPIKADEISFTFEGAEGEIKGNSFKALSEGNVKIKASLKNATGSMDVKVLGPVKDLISNTKNFNLDINSQRSLKDFYGKDKNGYEAKIYPEDIEFSLTNDIGYMEQGTFFSSDKPAGGAITARIGEGIENILVSIGSQGTSVEGFEVEKNFSFASYPKDVPGSIFLSNDAKEGSYSMGLRYDFTQHNVTRAAYLNLHSNEKLGLQFAGRPRKIGLWVNGDNNGGWLRASIRDGKGKEHLIDLTKTVDFTGWKYLTTDLPSGISYPVSIERIYIAEIDGLKKPIGQLLFDGLVAYYPSPYGNLVLPTPTTLKDDKNIKNNVAKDGFTFSIAGEPRNIDELVGYQASKSIQNRISKSKIGILLNGSSKEFKSGLKNYALIDTSAAYSKNRHMNTLFINMSNAKGGIRATNPDQWQYLKNDLNNTPLENILIFMQNPVFGNLGFKDKLEADLFHETLVEARERGKNIFVIHGGENNNSVLKDSIRYMEINTKDLKDSEDVYDLSIIEFVVNGQDISYQINPLFQKPKITSGK